MRRPKRGRPRIGRRAMTNTQRQARWRKRKRETEAARPSQQEQELLRRAYQPPFGYGRAKQQLIDQGHQFARARREFGFEEGVFVDGALLGSRQVIALAEQSPHERQQWLAEQRRATKVFACNSVQQYMELMRVSLDELITAAKGRKPRHERPIVIVRDA